MNGIVWTIEYPSIHSGQQTVLHAYNANSIANEPYNSSVAGTRDQLSQGGVFAPPTIAGGEVFVPGSAQLTFFGLLNKQPAPAGYAIDAGGAAAGSYAADSNYTGGIAGATTAAIGQASPMLGGPNARVLCKIFNARADLHRHVVFRQHRRASQKAIIDRNTMAGSNLRPLWLRSSSGGAKFAYVPPRIASACNGTVERAFVTARF